MSKNGGLYSSTIPEKTTELRFFMFVFFHICYYIAFDFFTDKNADVCWDWKSLLTISIKQWFGSLKVGSANTSVGGWLEDIQGVYEQHMAADTMG